MPPTREGFIGHKEHGIALHWDFISYCDSFNVQYLTELLTSNCIDFQPKLLHLTMADDNDFVPSLTADDSLSSFSMTCVPRQSVNRCFKRFGDEPAGLL